MQSGLQVQPLQRVQVSHRNRTRLILQNRKLLGEVYKLEQLISTVIEKTVTEQFVYLEQSQELHQKYQHDQEEQLRTIARLKREIKTTRAALAQHKFVEIRNEENAVTYLKREAERLASERDTLARKKQEKEEELQFHKPINAQTATTREQYMRTKAQNNELKAKIHEVEREVAKWHNMKEMAKTAVPKEHDNPDYQMIRMDNEIAVMRKDMKRVDEKWRAKIEALDREYFGFKDIKNNKLAEIESLEKQCRNYEIHAASVRDQSAVASDRERVNGVSISPQKRREMQELLEEERKRLKRISPRGTEKTKTQKLSKITPIKVETGLTPIAESKEDPVPPVQPQALLPPLPEPPKGKMVESVGVGTTFYYADD